MAKKVIIAPESKDKSLVTFDEPEIDEHTLDEDTIEHRIALRKADLRTEFISVSSQLAESNFYFRNYKYQNADKLYPNTIDAMQRFVTKCFPYAKGGLLLIDEPINEREYLRSLDKHKKLKELGFRHVIIKESTTLYECLEQLGE